MTLKTLFITLLTVLPFALNAQDQRMIPEDEAPLWRAVGRLNNVNGGYCTATLIAPDQAITAAHCLFYPATQTPVEPADLRFVAGFRRDSFAAMTGVTAIAILPGYSPSGIKADPLSIPYDLALLQLDRPVLPSEAVPFSVIEWPEGPLKADIVGFGRDRPRIASIRSDCPSLGDHDGGKLMDCPIVPGLSGAPAVLSGSQDLLAVVTVSVGTMVKGEQSLIVPIAPRLATLRAILSD